MNCVHISYNDTSLKQQHVCHATSSKPIEYMAIIRPSFVIFGHVDKQKTIDERETISN